MMIKKIKCIASTIWIHVCCHSTYYYCKAQISNEFMYVLYIFSGVFCFVLRFPMKPKCRSRFFWPSPLHRQKDRVQKTYSLNKARRGRFEVDPGGLEMIQRRATAATSAGAVGWPVLQSLPELLKRGLVLEEATRRRRSSIYWFLCGWRLLLFWGGRLVGEEDGVKEGWG